MELFGESDIEGKTAREAASELGASFKRAGANESMVSEFRYDPFSFCKYLDLTPISCSLTPISCFPLFTWQLSLVIGLTVSDKS